MVVNLLQNVFGIPPTGKAPILKPCSDYSLYHSTKRSALRFNVNNLNRSANYIKAASPSQRSLMINCGGSSSHEPLSMNTHDDDVQGQKGIGIVQLFRGKTIFVIGATGFLAKVLIEKLLRTIPDVDKIYVLIKADNKEVATKRLKNEVINADIFKYLQQFHGKSYQSFMLSKLIPVAGNLCEPNLGFDNNVEAMMAESVDIIINSAANTNFYERYDVAVEINIKGPRHVMAFAGKCKKLKVFLQISTAYVNGERQGRIMEKPFKMGESIVNGASTEPTLLPILHVEEEIAFALASSHANGTKHMKDLGIERAKNYGWQDTYVFTKAMGEMLLGSMRGDIPLVILRPSIIESTYRDPFPGWIEGNKVIDPIVTYYGKGQISGFPVDPYGAIDVIPVDMVVNATLAAIAKHGGLRESEINVYHVASSIANPLLFKDIGIYFYQHFAKMPFLDSKGEPIQVKPFIFYNSVDDFSSHVWKEMMIKDHSSLLIENPKNTPMNKNHSRKLEKLCRKFMEQAKYLASIYEPYGFYGGRFDNTNTHSLIESMSNEERRVFHFDVGSIDWEDYLVNVHIPGLRRHVFKEGGI